MAVKICDFFFRCKAAEGCAMRTVRGGSYMGNDLEGVN